jgi:hypothetical protein
MQAELPLALDHRRIATINHLAGEAVRADVTPALIAAGAAVLALVVSTTLQVWIRHQELREARQHEVMRHRRDALHAALDVVDRVYANSPFGGEPAPHPHEWNLALAWDAMNKMTLYCARPRAVVTAFAHAIGVHNPETQAPPEYGPGQRREFLKEVSRELELPETDYLDPDIQWIAGLPGARVPPR